MDVHVSDASVAAPASSTPTIPPVTTTASSSFSFTATSSEPEPPRDGRIARSHRTIEHIVRALLELLERDGDLRPTAYQVAHRAGVSRRALYLHFESLEAVFATATERRVREVFTAWDPPGPDTRIGERIDWFTRQWSSMLEALGPLRRATALHEPFSNRVRSTLDRTRQWAREAVEHTFEPELSAVSDDERERLTAALHHVSSPSAWDDLRRQGADVPLAREAMHRLLHALFT